MVELVARITEEVDAVVAGVMVVTVAGMVVIIVVVEVIIIAVEVSIIAAVEAAAAVAVVVVIIGAVETLTVVVVIIGVAETITVVAVVVIEEGEVEIMVGEEGPTMITRGGVMMAMAKFLHLLRGLMVVLPVGIILQLLTLMVGTMLMVWRQFHHQLAMADRVLFHRVMVPLPLILMVVIPLWVVEGRHRLAMMEDMGVGQGLDVMVVVVVVGTVIGQLTFLKR